MRPLDKRKENFRTNKISSKIKWNIDKLVIDSRFCVLLLILNTWNNSMVHLQIMIKLGDGLSLPYHKLSKLGAHLVIVYSCCSYFWQLEESLLYLIKLMVKGCLVGSISGFPIYYHLCPKKINWSLTLEESQRFMPFLKTWNSIILQLKEKKNLKEEMELMFSYHCLIDHPSF